MQFVNEVQEETLLAETALLAPTDIWYTPLQLKLDLTKAQWHMNAFYKL